MTSALSCADISHHTYEPQSREKSREKSREEIKGRPKGNDRLAKPKGDMEEDQREINTRKHPKNRTEPRLGMRGPAEPPSEIHHFKCKVHHF